MKYNAYLMCKGAIMYSGSKEELGLVVSFAGLVYEI